MNIVHLSIPAPAANADLVKLDQQQIVRQALALVDENGFAAFNMRALAARLGVQASAIYWHVGSKDELVDIMATSFFQAAFGQVAHGENWREWLMAFGHALRAELVRHRDAAFICALGKPVDGGIDKAAELLAKPLLAMGLPAQAALTYEASVISLTVGWTLYEQSNKLHDFLAELVGFDSSYAIGLESLVRGFPSPD